MPEPAGGLPAIHPVEPADESNRRLIENVHPPGWRNPEPKPRYHVVVVGAGTAGLVSAAGAAGLGARVALVERNLMGGDCLNVGCVPSKAVLRAARAWHEARTGAARFGAPPLAAGARGDFGAAMARMRRLRAGISEHDGARRFRDLGIDVFLGDGRFVSPTEVEVDGARLRFRRAVVATGARPAVPDVPGFADLGHLTNETFFGLTELPARLVVLGCGPIGSEMAQAFARFGSRVIVVTKDPRVLPREDADAAATVERALLADGVELAFGCRLVSARREAGAKVLVIEQGEGGTRREIVGDEVLVAIGRQANVDGMGLEAAGVRYGQEGVEVDDRLRTTNPRIFACGDVASRLRFTHLADAQARIVIQNALFSAGPLKGGARASALVVPWCTYTSPEIAHVGMYAQDAEAKGIALDTLTLPLAEVDRAILDGDEEGFLRVHLKRGTDEILGATLVAEHAGDMLPELCLAMTKTIGLGAIASVIHPYPTQAEVIKKAADTWRRGKLTPMVKKLFGWWFRATG